MRQQAEKVCLKRPLAGIYETIILLLILLLDFYPMAKVSAELPDSNHSVEVINLQKARQLGRNASRFLKPNEELLAEEVIKLNLQDFDLNILGWTENELKEIMEYEDDFDRGRLDKEDFSEDEMYDYIVDWGKGESVKWIKDNFDWKTLTSELGLR